MDLISRIGTLFKAESHGMVDALQDKRLLLKQHLREAELELSRKRARVDTLDAETKRIADALALARAQIAALDEDIELALGEDKEDLARFAIKRLLPLRSQVAQLAQRAEQVAAERVGLSEQLQQQEQELEAMKARAAQHLAALAREAEEGGGDVMAPAGVADEEIDLELLRRKQRGGER